MRKRGIGYEDQNDVEGTSGDTQSGVRLASLGYEDLELV